MRVLQTSRSNALQKRVVIKNHYDQMCEEYGIVGNKGDFRAQDLLERLNSTGIHVGLEYLRTMMRGLGLKTTGGEASVSWTPEDTAFLSDNHETMTKRAIALELGRSENAVTNKLLRMRRKGTVAQSGRARKVEEEKVVLAQVISDLGLEDLDFEEYILPPE